MNEPDMAHLPQDSHLPRKLYHLTAASLIPTIYLIAPAVREWIIIAVTGFCFVWILFDLARIRIPALNDLFSRWLGFLMKQKENEKLLGMTYLLMGTTLVLLLFSPVIAATSLYFVAIGDPAASLVGKSIGRKKLVNDKTAEGSFAMFVVCFALALALHGALFTALAGALTACMAELYTGSLDDNLTVPVSAGLMMTIAENFA